MFRTSYGRENKASDYIIEDGTYVYIAKRYVRKWVNGKQKKFLETLIQVGLVSTAYVPTAFIQKT